MRFQILNMSNPIKQRYGDNFITSVSISGYFKDLMDTYNISPTEAFRRGMAVFLYDLGVPQYDSKKNKERSDYIKKFMHELEKNEDMKLKYNNIKKFVWVYDKLHKIKDVIDE